MIVIGRSVVHPYLVTETEPFFTVKEQILELMTSNHEVYAYQTLDQLSFDLDVRLQMVLACIDLFSSGLQFRTFNTSFCNPQFWERTKLGGFQLKPQALPSFAIRDIFTNGKKYGTECATAMIIIIYKALLEVYDEKTFNRLFANLLLYTWNYDSDLKIITKTGGEIIHGDIKYFKNPQVNPRTIEWQGENAIYLGDQFFYGHGVGVKTADQIIENLNMKRKPYAFLSAYLTDFTTRIDVREMSQYASTSKIKTQIKLIPIQNDAVVATVGHSTAIY
ncbi:protein-glutamine gamma-glutamyltransferase [Microbacteriaceae bacterium 4G12]